eukprot:77726_1
MIWTERYGRMMNQMNANTEINYKGIRRWMCISCLRLELQRNVKENLDNVSKLNRDKDELNMYRLFKDCLSYAWSAYNRQYIVKQFDSWNRKEDGDIKWNITFNMGSCTKLKNKKRLNKSIVWRTAATAFLTFTKNLNSSDCPM